MPSSKKNHKKEHLRIAQECEILANKKISEWIPANSEWITDVGCALTRLSTEHQSSTDFGSLEQQIHLAFEEAAERSRHEHRNYKIEMVFIEAGISGRLTNRPALRRMLNDIKRGKYKFVITRIRALNFRKTHEPPADLGFAQVGQNHHLGERQKSQKITT